MIEARAVTVVASGRRVLDAASFEARPGTVVALVGPNGAGKSTLLRVLAGERAPDEGEVRLFERPLASYPPRARARRLAVLPQESSLAFPFAAIEVVLLGRAPHSPGGETARDCAVARLAMAATDTRAFEERRYTSLSGGERQRVQAARSLAQVWEGPEGRVLLLDEPTSSLDLAHQHLLLARARRMAGDGCAVVCVLHDLNLAAQYADAMVVLAGGAVVATGRPRDVLDAEILGRVFGVDAVVIEHPKLGCPLVVPTGAEARRKGSNDAYT